MNIVSMPEQTWAFLEGRSAIASQSISAALASVFDDVNGRIIGGDIRTTGAPCAHYRACSGGELRFEIGVPINPDDAEVARKAGLSVGETFKGQALLHVHRGSYAQLGDAYREMQKDFRAKGLKGRDDLWEVYLNDPDTCPSADLLTQILWPVESTGSRSEGLEYHGIS